jgi:hypothetical protein
METFWKKTCRELYRRTVLTEVQGQEMTNQALDDTTWEEDIPWTTQIMPRKREKGREGHTAKIILLFLFLWKLILTCVVAQVNTCAQFTTGIMIMT